MERLGYSFEHKKAPPPKPTGPHKDRRPKIRGSIFKRPLPISRPGGRPR